MDPRTLRRIFDWLKRLQDRSLTRSIGTVIDDSPFVVEIAGVEHSGLAKLTSYSPTIGDVVYVVRSGKDLIVLGEVG